MLASIIGPPLAARRTGSDAASRVATTGEMSSA
jgi:hypothetical protein